MQFMNVDALASLYKNCIEQTEYLQVTLF